MDPLTSSYPMLTPYQFASNSPIDGVDLDGLEYLDADEARIEAKYGRVQLKVENFNFIFRSNWNLANNPKNWAPGQIGLSKTIANLSFNTSTGKITEHNLESTITYPSQLGTLKKPSLFGSSKDPTTDFTEIAIEGRPTNKDGSLNMRFAVNKKQPNEFSSLDSRRVTVGGRAVGIAFLVNAAIENYAIYGFANDKSLLSEQVKVPLFESIHDLQSALNTSDLIPDQFRNDRDLTDILNVVLQGESSNDEIFKIGIDILKRSGVEINKKSRDRLRKIEAKENCRTCGLER